MFELSTRARFVQEQVRYAGIVRGGTTVTVYVCFSKDAPVISKAALQDVAACYLDGNCKVIAIDLRR